MKTFLSVLFLTAGLFLSAQPDNLFRRANEAYAEGNYSAALDLYNRAGENGWTSAQLEYNRGNAAYKLGNWPLAILSYRRALRINPSDADAQHNLGLARTKRIDQVEALPLSPVNRLVRFVLGLMSPAGWAGAGAVLGLLAALSLALRLFLRFGRGWAFGSLIFALLALATGLMARVAEARRTAAREAVVMASNVYVKTEPDKGAQDAFILHAGAEVELKRTLDKWTEIRLPDGKVGWLPVNSYEEI